MAESKRTARCGCGALTITTVGEPQSVVACHCIDCQRRSGSPFGLGAYFAPGAGPFGVGTLDAPLVELPVQHHFTKGRTG